MTYPEVLKYLYEQLPMFQRQGPVAFKKDLGNIKLLCDRIGNPEQSQKFIHLAGTNGKGSTSHILASILQAHGFSVGLYTSPHYKDFRERIKINAKFISKRQVSSFINKYKNDFDEIQPSFFEITVALAFWYFKKKKVDFAIIETGLGGRLDSTNIISPLISVITNIGWDHQNMLGDTLELIAGEKAGIIKENIPVIIGEYQSKLKSVFFNKAKQENAPIKYSKNFVSVKWGREEGAKKTIGKYKNLEVAFKDKRIGNFKCSTDLKGIYQVKNLQTALATYYALAEREVFNFSKTKLTKGLKNVSANTYFIGRWMFLNKTPLILADSAHNVDGLKLVMKELKKLPHEHLHLVLGTVMDKDPTKVLKLLPKKATYYFAKANIPRGMNANELMKIASKNGLKGSSHSSVSKAIQTAKVSAKKKDLIYIGGSIFVVAEALQNSRF